ncbi:MAG: acyl-CoA dehydrogenase family protein, partial [Halieaceae bacterium]|nr:acyl-CoA dehydrogenase family protein [Halieaceae bacterium]
MDFTFTEEQLLLRDTARDVLRKEVTTERIRALWDTDSGRSDALWAQLAELGLTSLLVPEDCGGQGLDEVDYILLAQECGYVALPEPVVQT